MLSYGLPAVQQGSGSKALKNEPPMDFKTVDVRLLYWQLSGQAVMSAVSSCGGKQFRVCCQSSSASYSWGFILLPLFYP